MKVIQKKCSQCDFSSSHGGSLRAHLKMHSGEKSNHKPFECISCLKYFRNASKLKEHALIHSNDKPYKCTSCSKSYNNHGSLSHHRQIHNPNNVSCDLCQKRFISKDRLKAHMKHHLEELETTKCSVCSKYIQSRSFTEHSYTHTGEKPFVCSTCQKGFNNRGSLSHHRKLHSVKQYLCSICEKAFPNQSQLGNHKKSHLGSKTGKQESKAMKRQTEYKLCEICQKYVKRLNDHTMGVHSTERNFNCEHCSKSYKTALALRDHTIRKHTDSLDHQCSTCGKKFNVERVLKKHIELHSDENMKCKICNKSFPHLAAVEAHEKRHNKEFDKIQCELCPQLIREDYMDKHKQMHGSQNRMCSVCQKVLKTNGELKKHEQIHTERKRAFECKICDGRMHSMTLLKSHSLIHTTETPYSCSIEDCDQRFNNAGSLSHHKMKHKQINGLGRGLEVS